MTGVQTCALPISYCKKKGHIRDECRHLKAAENKEQKTSTSEKEKKDGELTAKVTTITEQPAKTESLHLFVANALTQRSSLLVKWIIDSGASLPMSSQRNWFHMYRDISPLKKVWLGDERYILATGIGQLHLEMNLSGGKKCLTIIRTTYYVPNLSGNLISISYLTKQGYSVNFDNCQCWIFTKSGKLCGVAQDVDNLYILNAKPVNPERAYISCTMSEMNESSDLEPSTLETAFIAKTKKSKATLGIWHRRLGHIVLDAVKAQHGHWDGDRI